MARSPADLAAIRRHCDRRLKALDNERTSWFSHWQDLSKFILPRRGRFLVSANQNDKGRKLNTAILDETATFASRTFASGLMSGITSPARPWFRFTLANRDPRNESGAVKKWAADLKDVVLATLARSNAYNALGAVYEELGVFGQGVLLVDEDDEDDIRCYALTVGEYYLGSSARLAVDSLYREFQMTVGQLVQRFGLDACSDRVKALHKAGTLDTEIDVVHAIEPNDNRVVDSALSEDMPFRSVYFEKGQNVDKLAALKGYAEFPAMCPRWATTGNDSYGRSPGMDGLPAVRSLQLLQRRLAELIDKSSRPPMTAPVTLQNQPMSLLPGGVTFVADPTGQTFKPAMLVQPTAITAVQADIAAKQRVVQRAFFEDLFLMLSQMDGVQPRQNLEVIERREEKMLMLGPALERLHDELLDPFLKRVISILGRRGKLPPPPQEILETGGELQIEYISVLAQAQKSVGLTSIERLFAFVGNQAAVNPSILDKIDMDAGVDAYADMLNAPPDVIVSAERVAAIRDARAKQAQQQQAAEQGLAAVQGAKLLSETEVGGGANALQRMTGLA